MGRYKKSRPYHLYIFTLSIHLPVALFAMGFNIIKKLNTAKVTIYSVVFEPQLLD